MTTICDVQEALTIGYIPLALIKRGVKQLCICMKSDVSFLREDDYTRHMSTSNSK